MNSLNAYSVVVRLGDRAVFMSTSLIDGMEDRLLERALG